MAGEVATIMCVFNPGGSEVPGGAAKEGQKTRTQNGPPECHLGPASLFARGSYVWHHLAN